MKVYRDRVDLDEIVKDAGTIDVSPEERSLARCPSMARSIRGCRVETTCRTAASCSTTDSIAPPSVAFERAADANPAHPRCIGSARCSPEAGRRRGLAPRIERALALQPDLAEANNDLGALLAQGGDLDAAIGRFRAALASTPDYPDALNNLGYRAAAHRT